MRYKLSYLLIGLTALAICSAVAKEVYFQPPNLIAVESFSQWQRVTRKNRCVVLVSSSTKPEAQILTQLDSLGQWSKDHWHRVRVIWLPQDAKSTHFISQGLITENGFLRISLTKELLSEAAA